MDRLKLILVALCLSLIVAAPVAAQGAPTVKVTADPKLGNILTDAQGKTLYIWTRDDANVSNCYDQCAQRWMALVVTGQPVAPAGLTGTLGLAARRDGAQQVTYNSMPLYNFSGDANPGDTNGQNVGTVWFVVAPGATKSSFPAPPPPPAAAPAPAAAAPAAVAQLPRTGGTPLNGSIPAGLAAGLLSLVAGAWARRRR